MPGSVSGNNGVNPYITAGWQQAAPQLQQLGLDSKFSTQIGNLLNGNSDAVFTGVTDGVVDNLVSDPVANAAIKGTIDIVKTVLMGNYKTGEDTKEATTNLKNITDTGTMSNALADSGKDAGQQILSQLQSNIEGFNGTINEATNQIVVTLQDGSQQTIELSEQNIETSELIAKNQEQIDKNNTEIESKQQQLSELSNKIAAKKAELGMSAEAPAPAPAGEGGEGGEGSSKVGSNFVNMEMDGIDNSELQELIQQYNGLGAEITGLQLQNTELGNQNTEYITAIQNNTEVAQANVETSMEVTDEQSSYIDDQTNNIVSMCNDAKSAIGEVQKLLQGQFPKLDKVTTVKLATSMTKSAICGTNGGLLATAAAAMGVSSVFSFGSTAQKAAELGAASGDQFAASAKHIATNVAGKLIQQQMMAYMNQTFANISQMTGVDLTQMQSLMNEYVQEQSSVRNDAMMAYQQVQEQTPVSGESVA